MVLFGGPHIEFLGHLDNSNKTKLNTNILCYLLAIVLQTKFHEMVCQSIYTQASPKISDPIPAPPTSPSFHRSYPSSFDTVLHDLFFFSLRTFTPSSLLPPPPLYALAPYLVCLIPCPFSPSFALSVSRFFSFLLLHPVLWDHSIIT